VLPKAVNEHKMLFNLLYGQLFDFEVGDMHQITTTVNNIIGYAVYWEMLPAVAQPLENLVLGIPGIWADIAKRSIPYLVIGNVRSIDPSDAASDAETPSTRIRRLN
jgi:hypothetical protein